MNKTVNTTSLTHHEASRYFNNPLLERLAYTSSLTVNIIFIPIILTFAYFSFTKHSLIFTLVGFIAGLLVWSFVEYVMHRFAFHFKFTNTKIKSLHAILHLSHHQHPNDKRKYQTLLLISFPSGLLFYFLLKSLFRFYIDPIYLGFVTGYVLYEFAHYSTHKFKMDSKFLKALKQHHMHHHFLSQEKNYGVTSAFWDIVFKTHLSHKEKLILLQKKVNIK